MLTLFNPKRTIKLHAIISLKRERRSTRYGTRIDKSIGSRKKKNITLSPWNPGTCKVPKHLKYVYFIKNKILKLILSFCV